jgi:hypothetical protein
MLTPQFDDDVLVVRPSGLIMSADVETLDRTANEYLATHPKIPGVMIQTRTFPGFASIGAFGGYVRFVLGHRTRVRRSARHRLNARALREVHGQPRSGRRDAPLSVCRRRRAASLA